MFAVASAPPRVRIDRMLLSFMVTTPRRGTHAGGHAFTTVISRWERSLHVEGLAEDLHPVVRVRLIDHPVRDHHAVVGRRRRCEESERADERILVARDRRAH